VYVKILLLKSKQLQRCSGGLGITTLIHQPIRNSENLPYQCIKGFFTGYQNQMM